jgi:CRP-like cAMP-binding protein
MITLERALHLGQVPLFAGLEVGALTRLAETAEEVALPAGATLFAAGEPGDAMFVVVEGSVAIELEGRRLATLDAGQHFGEMSLLDGEPRSASAIAIEDCLLLRLDQAMLYEVLARHFPAALELLRTLSRRLRQTLADADSARA